MRDFQHFARKAIGKYLREHDTTVTAFYVSNVEQYLFQVQGGRGNRNGGAQTFYENVAVLPLDSSSWFVRSGASGLGAGGMNTTSVASMMETLAAVRQQLNVFNYPVSQCSALFHLRTGPDGPHHHPLNNRLQHPNTDRKKPQQYEIPKCLLK
jgi:hypothetical protein